MSIFKIFADYKLFEVFVLGIVSGMPLSIIFSTLSAWLHEAHIPLAVITTFAVAKTPYAFKYLWAPVIDYVRLPIPGRFGHRKAWLILCSFLVSLVLFTISGLQVNSSLPQLYFL